MDLIDAHLRRIDYLRVSVTDRCNLSCVYCKPRGRIKMLAHRDILTYEEILRIVSVAAPLGITHVRITGGEPLVRRGVVDFIGALGGCEGVKDISLTTNGILLEEKAEALAAAGKPRLNVSLDSLSPGKFRSMTGRDGWNRVWRGISRAEELGFFPLKINMVPVRGVNDDEIVDFARMTLERSLHVRFIEFMPIGAGDRWTRESCISSDEVRGIVEREFGPLRPLAGGDTAGPATTYQIAGARGVIGLISPITRHFCASCRRLRLTADGRLRPCLLSDTEIDVKTPLRSGCDDAALEAVLRLALESKPERHALSGNGPGFFQRTMSKIGG